MANYKIGWIRKNAGISPDPAAYFSGKHWKVIFTPFLASLHLIDYKYSMTRNRARNGFLHAFAVVLLYSNKNSMMNTALQPSNKGYKSAIRNSADEASCSDKAAVINMSEIATPLGPMLAGAISTGICLLEFTNGIRLEKEFSDLRKMLNSAMLPGRNQYSDQLEKELNEYFAGKRKIFSVPLHTPAMNFHNRFGKRYKISLMEKHAPIRSRRR